MSSLKRWSSDRFRNYGSEDMDKVKEWVAGQRKELPFVFKSHVASPTGYAQSARWMLRAFLEHGLAVSYSCLGDANEYEAGCGDEVVDCVHLWPGDFAQPQVVYSIAPLFYHNSGAYRIGWTMLEVKGVNPDWARACNLMNEVWVPTPRQAKAFRESGVIRPVKVMPLCVDPWWFNLDGAAATWEGGPGIRFLSVGWWTQRKGFEELAKAWMLAFGESPRVRLVIKTMCSLGKEDLWNAFRGLFKGRKPRNVDLIEGEIPLEVMGAFYRMFDCFVYSGYGEGWGMPLQEALMCGLPVISTDAMGATETMSDAWGGLYPGVRLVKSWPTLAKDTHPYYEGLECEKPDVDDLAEKLTFAVENLDYLKQETREGAARITADKNPGVTARLVGMEIASAWEGLKEGGLNPQRGGYPPPMEGGEV